MGEHADGEQARMLVVDDTPANAKLLSDLIQHHPISRSISPGNSNS